MQSRAEHLQRASKTGQHRLYFTSNHWKGGGGSGQGCLPMGSSPGGAAGCARAHR